MSTAGASGPSWSLDSERGRRHRLGGGVLLLVTPTRVILLRGGLGSNEPSFAVRSSAPSRLARFAGIREGLGSPRLPAQSRSLFSWERPGRGARHTRASPPSRRLFMFPVRGDNGLVVLGTGPPLKGPVRGVCRPVQSFIKSCVLFESFLGKTTSSSR